MTAPQFDNIPTDLKNRKQWVLWKQITRAGKPTKVPYQVNGREADSSDPKTWSTYEAVVEHYKAHSNEHAGIGYVFDPLDPFAGVDLDNCIGEGGAIEPQAKSILDLLSSYSEISPSGKGIKIFVKAQLPVKVGDPQRPQLGFKHPKNPEVEIYFGKRFFTLTGERIPDYPATIEDRNSELTAIFRELFADRGYFGEGITRLARDESPRSTAPGDISDKLAAIFAADPKLRADFFTPAAVGERSDREFNLCARLWEAGLTEEEIYAAMDLSPQEKWHERPNDAYHLMTIRKAAAKAGAASDLLKDLPARLKENPRAIKEPGVIDALARLKVDDPIDFDITMGEIKAAARSIKIETVKDLVAGCIEAAAKEAKAARPAEPAIKDKALAIAARGDPFKYLIWQSQRNHLGDIDYQKVLLLSIAAAASETNHGIQPGGNGEKGSGKSDACEATYHLIPEDRRMDGSLSPMSLFYLQETGQLQPGMVLFSDDVEYGPIIPIYKRSTGKFQRASNHYTVTSGKDRKSLKLTIPPRVVWWLTSVESVANDQAFDRQYPISTDSSPDHKKRVAREIADRRARKEKLLAEDEGIEVARAIIADMFDNGPFKVTIPQANGAKWLKTSDFRGQEQFWDLVDALVIMRWRQHRRDAEGWLIAEDRDLIEAKDLMMAHKVALFADLTEAEVKVVGVLSDGMPRTQSDLTEALGVAQCTVSLRLKSILAKSSIITEDIDRGKKIYRLNPSTDLNASYWQGVDLIELGGIDDGGRYCSQQIALLHCYLYVIGVPIGVVISNSNRLPSSLFVNREMIKDEDIPVGCKKCFGWNIPSSSYKPAQDTNNDQKQQQATLFGGNNGQIPDTNSPNNAIGGSHETQIREAGDAVDGITAELAAADAQDDAQRAHFSEKAEKITSKPSDRIIYRPKGAALEYSLLAANLWIGCSHGCTYCYGPNSVHRTRQDYLQPKLRNNIFSRLERDLAELQRQGNITPVHLMFAGDPYSPPGGDFDLPRQALQLFRRYDQPFQVLTKGGTKAARDFDLYGPKDRFGATLTFLDPAKSSLWEPGAAPPSDRIESLRQAHERGITTWASCEPVIEPDETLAVIEAAAPYVDFFAVGKWNHDTRANSIDWAKFKDDVVALLERLQKPYKLKNDLLKAATKPPKPSAPKAEIPRPYCYLAKVRGAAIIEYGYNGWVDPAKIARAAGILECQACRALVHLDYEQIERQGGGIGFRQTAAKRGEAEA